ncbi:MAG: hypothetical protein K8U57_38180, partial [Planctomycetes bacterium]|nr:hypothetical protein [Planctomycetota bacterium]
FGVPQLALRVLEGGGARRPAEVKETSAGSEIMFSEKKRQDYSDRLLEPVIDFTCGFSGVLTDSGA